MSEEIVYCIAGNMTSNVSVRILLSQSEAGRLIGEKGKMIKLLRENFPCDFKLNGFDASQRIMNKVTSIVYLLQLLSLLT